MNRPAGPTPDAPGRALVIGCGNPDRRDDGAGFQIIGRLRKQLGLEPPAEEETGILELGAQDRALLCRQLLPELAVEAGGYDRLIIVDAHVTGEGRRLVCTRIRPEAPPSSLSHSLPPEAFLRLVGIITGRAPRAFLVSVRGHRFDLQPGLTPQTAALVGPAARVVRRLLARKGCCPGVQAEA